MKKKKVFCFFCFLMFLALLFSGCQKQEKKKDNMKAIVSEITSTPNSSRYSDMEYLSDTEQKKLSVQTLSEKDRIYKIHLYEEEIEDTYVLYVALPGKLDRKREYPVVYLLGAKPLLSDIRMLQNKEGNSVEKIYVAVTYPDYVKTKERQQRDFVENKEKFYRMITDKIMPLIETLYQGDLTQSTLCAEGKAASYISEYGIFDDGFKFKHYILVSPDYKHSAYKGSVLFKEEDYAEHEVELKTSVYFYIGKDSDETENSIYTKNFASAVQKHNFTGCSVSYEEIDGYGSSTVWFPAITEAMYEIYGESVSAQESAVDFSPKFEEELPGWKYSKMGMSVNETIWEDDCQACNLVSGQNYQIQVFYNNGYSAASSQNLIILPYTELTAEEIGSLLEKQNLNGRVLIMTIKGTEIDDENQDMKQNPETFLSFLCTQVLGKLKSGMELSFDKISIAGGHAEGYFSLYAYFHQDTICHGRINQFISWYPELTYVTENKTIAAWKNFWKERGGDEERNSHLTIYLEKLGKKNKNKKYRRMLQSLKREAEENCSISLEQKTEKRVEYQKLLLKIVKND